MKKWYEEEYKFEVEVIGFLRSDHTEHYCRNGEEIGDQYTCTYGCPVNDQGQGICSKLMMVLFPIMEAVRSGGDLENIGGSGKYVKEVVCPDGAGNRTGRDLSGIQLILTRLGFGFRNTISTIRTASQSHSSFWNLQSIHTRGKNPDPMFIEHGNGFTKSRC